MTALDLVRKEASGYDKEKYREMLLQATETVLGHFGFDRTVYGDTGGGDVILTITNITN